MAGSTFLSAAPYHIISYGTLLGSSFFHSFINAPVTFKTVERPVFGAIQTNIFPIYFGIQTIVPVILAVTFPGNTLTGVPSGISGILDVSSRWDSLAPIATMFVTGLINWTVLLPASAKVKKERIGQGKRDGKEWFADGPHSDEMQALNKRFGMLHGMSSLLNLASIIAVVAYGFTIGARLQSIVDRVA